MTIDKKAKSLKLRSDSILPLSTREFGRLSELVDFYRWLWQYAPIKTDASSTQLLRLYMSLIIDSALPHSAAIDCLMAFEEQQARVFEPIAIPIHRKERSQRFTRLSLHDISSLAGSCLQAWPPALQDVVKVRPNRRRRRLASALRCQFTHARSLYDSAGDLVFADIQRLGPLLAVENGAEPFLISVLDGRVRPTSQRLDDVYFLHGVSHESMNHLLQPLAGDLVPEETSTASMPSDSLAAPSVPSSWISDSRHLLRKLCAEFEDTHPGRLKTAMQREKAQAILDRYAVEAATKAPPDSALMLAIKYVGACYIDRPTITAGTLRDYLDRTVINGLLDTEASYSLGDWDPDDFIEVVEARLSNPRLGRTTRRLILDAYTPLLQFLATELQLPRISISTLREDYVAGSGQSSLISPFAIDKLIGSLYGDDRYELRQAAVILALGYYGGLRAGEARKLTLANIVFHDDLDELDVELLRGKTEYSRRRLPFDALATPSVQKIIRDYWRERRAQFRAGLPLSRIALFGPEGDAHAYRYQSITRLARRILKSVFGPSVTLHSLRHCFCSFLVLRWYSLRYPAMLDDLRDRGHPIFQPGLQSRLQQYFDCMPKEDGDIRPYDLISIIKLTGHAGPEVLFQYYVHSFSSVQAHAVRQIRSPVSDVPLSGQLQAKLSPRMKSPATRAKYGARTLADMARIAVESRRACAPASASKH